MMNNITSKINQQRRVVYPLMDSWAREEKKIQQEVPIPAYLEEVYWWAYVARMLSRFSTDPGSSI